MSVASLPIDIHVRVQSPKLANIESANSTVST